MDDQNPKEEDFMDFKDPFFDHLEKIKEKTFADTVPDVQSGKPLEHQLAHSSQLREVLRRIQVDVERALKLLTNADTLKTPNVSKPEVALTHHEKPSPSGETVIEGLFDGQEMIGPDKKRYPVPPNYASKSKLVEGDGLKLTISPSGSFLYKQIHPIERERKMGTLELDPTTRLYTVKCDERSLKVLTASVTYFKGVPGDEVVILVPKSGEPIWAAVEHIIKKYQ